jgi:hypothetical protein
MSELNHRQKRYEKAVELAEEALDIANRLKRSDMQCKLLVQLLHLKTGLGRITPIEAEGRLQLMLEQYSDQAAIRYAMWKQNPGSLEHRTAALLLNEELYRKSGKEEYLVRCREMDYLREATAAARPMPQLVVEVTQQKRISPNILTEIDRFLNL